MDNRHRRISDTCRFIIDRVQDTASEKLDEGVRSGLLEMMSQLEFAETVNSSLDLDEILSVFLLTAMGKMLTTTGVVLVLENQGQLTVRGCRGGSSSGLEGRSVRLRRPFKRPLLASPGEGTKRSGKSGAQLLREPLLEPLQLHVLLPIWQKKQFIGAVGFGQRLSRKGYEPGDIRYLEALTAIAATAIENGLIYEEVKTLNRDLQLKIFQLSSLFDVSKELVSSFDSQNILTVMVNSLMGQTGVRKCALLVRREISTGPFTFSLKRGITPSEAELKSLSRINPDKLKTLPEAHCGLSGVRKTSRALARLFDAWGLNCFFPLRTGDRCHSLLAVGDKLTGQPLNRGDREFIATLCSQAVTAMENAELHNQMVEKERLEKELSIARTIQQSLLPRRAPSIAGVDLSQLNSPCYEVGGDYHDFIVSDDYHLGVVVADVTGKSTPASLVMASVQASLRALTMKIHLPPEELIRRINTLLFHSTEPNRFVSLFFAEMETSSGLLKYVNAGHNPPLLIRHGGAVEELTGGGMVLGMFEDAPYQCQTAELAPGDALLLFTDGLSEANNPEGEEFGEQRITQTARKHLPSGAEKISRAILDDVARFQKGLKPHDDLTLVVMKKL